MADNYISVTERLFAIVRSLNLTNLLMIALLLMLAVPTYFAWRFLTDEAFRQEFMQGGKILDKHVPCIVLEGHTYGRATRHTVVAVYELDGRFEKLIGVRAPGKWTDEEINTVCQVVLSEAGRISRDRDAARDREQKP